MSLSLEANRGSKAYDTRNARRLCRALMILNSDLSGDEPRVVNDQGRWVGFAELFAESTPVSPTDDNLGASVRRTLARDRYPPRFVHPLRQKESVK